MKNKKIYSLLLFIMSFMAFKIQASSQSYAQYWCLKKWGNDSSCSSSNKGFSLGYAEGLNFCQDLKENALHMSYGVFYKVNTLAQVFLTEDNLKYRHGFNLALVNECASKFVYYDSEGRPSLPPHFAARLDGYQQERMARKRHRGFVYWLEYYYPKSQNCQWVTHEHIYPNTACLGYENGYQKGLETVDSLQDVINQSNAQFFWEKYSYKVFNYDFFPLLRANGAQEYQKGFNQALRDEIQCLGPAHASL